MKRGELFLGFAAPKFGSLGKLLYLCIINQKVKYGNKSLEVNP